MCYPTPVCSSDHLGLITTIDCNIINEPEKSLKTIRSYKQFNRSAFCEDLLNTDMSKFNMAINNKDIELAAELLQNTLHQTLNKHAPEKTIVLHPNYAPWVTLEMRNELKQRNKMRYVAMKTKLHQDWKRYHEYRNQINYKLRKAKIEYNKLKFSECGDNVNEVWNRIKTITKKHQYKCNASTKDELNNINKFFSKVGENIKTTTHTSPNYSTIETPTELFNFNTVTEIDTIKAVSMLPNWKAPGNDGLNGYVIKAALPALAKPLTQLINLSLSQSVFPSVFKFTIVSPIPKTAAATTPDHQHRPLALLSLLSKVIERVAYLQLYPFISPLLSICQHGFQLGRSTVTALLNITEKIYNSMDHHKLSLLILMDLSKAFDSLQHDILLHKLRLIGLSNHVLSWMKSYLDDRTQVIKVGNIYSDKIILTCGVPQGSILGPLLFLVYVNDLPNVIKYGNVGQFADDTQLLYNYKPKSFRSLSEIEKKISDDLTAITSWFQSNSLLLNSKKTKIMAIAHKKVRDTQLPTISVKGEPLEYVHEARNLGILFDENMTFKNHVKQIIKTATYRLRALAKQRTFIPQELFIQIVESKVLQPSIYALEVWSSCNKTEIKKVQVSIQNWCAKLVVGRRKFEKMDNLLDELGWLSIDKLVELRTVCTARQAAHGLYGSAMKSLFNKSNSSYDTRKKLYTLPRVHTDRGKRSFSFRGAELLNKYNHLEHYNKNKYKNEIKNSLITEK